ncbi:MAG: cobaltochelatase subunit CobN, partial [Immundisolibacteraceae bacterium]|nr:cobaltochelatase subunit CobN [Immundisolibacteraceae bacterium]
MAYKAALQGTEVVLRTWSDRTLSPLSNKYMWYRGGSLCLAVAEWTGRQPDFVLNDVRDPARTGLISAEKALTRDFRVRLLNSTWARGMMTEGYAGADQVAKAVSNVMGWSIMRPGSVSPRQFEAIVDSWVRDEWHLGVRDWFEGQNPHAFQELTE